MKTHLLLATAALSLPWLSPAATQTVIPGPPGSGAFGQEVIMLPNGNFLVRDSLYSQVNPPVAEVGAVYLFSPQGGLISTLVGSQAGDRVGFSGVIVLPNGHFVVRSPNWRNGAVVNAGAVTWGHAETGWGVSQVVPVSAANSLLGSTLNDDVGANAITLLTNGNYVVRSGGWNNGALTDVGAVTWCNGQGGTVGPISAANSLVGGTNFDQIGVTVTALVNGNYVVRSLNWDNGAVVNAGAVTWCNGLGGTVGPVTPANSLVGSQANDSVGSVGIIPLSNGNYVAFSPNWDNGAVVNVGAATLCNGLGGTVGPVTPANSLVGSQPNDQVGTSGTALSNGNYVVISVNWQNGAVVGAGAVTWGKGQGGTVGPVTPANSLVGGQANDNVGSGFITVLSNGNYVVRSPNWDNGAAVNAGAVTWGNGQGGTVGVVTPANSLVGSQTNDDLGNFITPLSNGNYVVCSPFWDNGAVVNAGAATWGNGLGGTVGPVSPANSLVGSQTEDRVSNNSATALSNGNYVVNSPAWDNGTVANTGAVTWGNGKTGIRGLISPANSLVGGQTSDQVGNGFIAVLKNGNYVVSSASWKNGPMAFAGAATWGNGLGGTVGLVTPANSLVGSQAGDEVGLAITALSNGNYVARSSLWDNGAVVNAGAVTWGNGLGGSVGPVTPANSLVGSQTDDRVGNGTVTKLDDGSYTVRSTLWDDGALVDSGAVTLGDGETGIVGLMDASNSALGHYRGAVEPWLLLMTPCAGIS